MHKTLQHRHITKLYDQFEDEDHVYLLLEYASKGSLAFKARQHTRLTEDVARKYFKQTTEGILYLHLNHIIHRDLKPENILLDSKDNVKICDFGWCAKANKQRKTFCGTLDYMAPEMFSLEGHSFEVDLWALGVLLYDLLHGRTPFSALSTEDVGQQIVECQFDIDKDVSFEAADLIKQLITLDPEQRLQAAEILRHPWVEKWSDRPIGGSVSVIVPEYGYVEGIVQEIVGDKCVIYHELLDSISTLPLEEVSQLISNPIRLSSSESWDYSNRDPDQSDRDSVLSRPTKDSFRPPVVLFGDSSSAGRYRPQVFLFEDSSAEDRYSTDPSGPKINSAKSHDFEGDCYAKTQEMSIFAESTEEGSPKVTEFLKRRMVEDTFAIGGRLFEDKAELTELRSSQVSYFQALARGWSGVEFDRVKPSRVANTKSGIVSMEALIKEDPKQRSQIKLDESPETLNQRRNELAQLMLKLNCTKKKRETPKQTEESRGFFSWIGNIFGCSNRG